MTIRGGDMNDDTRIFTLSTVDDKSIGEWLQYFGRDLVSWTHTSAAPSGQYSPIWHFVTARVTEHYGDFEDDMYVPFE